MAALQARHNVAAARGASRTPACAPFVAVGPSSNCRVQQQATFAPFQGAPGLAQKLVRSSRLVAHATYHGPVIAKPNMKFGVVVAKFNSLITKGLLEGAMDAFESHGVPADNVDVAWVPGSFEVPVVAKQMAKSGKYSAVVCIGAVIRGATSHYDAVVSAVTSGVLSASTDSGVPVIFGVLTTDTLEQALDRTGGKVGNKGGEAAITAVEMATLMAKLKEDKCIA